MMQDSGKSGTADTPTTVTRNSVYFSFFNSFPGLALSLSPHPRIIIVTLFRDGDNYNHQAPLGPIKGHPVPYSSSFNVQIKLLRDLVIQQSLRGQGWVGPGNLHF